MKEGGDVRKSTSVERKMYPGVWTMDCVRGGKVISIQDNHSWWFPSTMLWPYKKFVFPKISIFLNGNYYYFYYYSSSFIYLFIFIIMMMMFGRGFLWWKMQSWKGKPLSLLVPLCCFTFS